MWIFEPGTYSASVRVGQAAGTTGKASLCLTYKHSSLIHVRNGGERGSRHSHPGAQLHLDTRFCDDRGREKRAWTSLFCTRFIGQRKSRCPIPRNMSAPDRHLSGTVGTPPTPEQRPAQTGPGSGVPPPSPLPEAAWDPRPRASRWSSQGAFAFWSWRCPVP